MNVAYNEISCVDAAKMIGVDKSTITAWRRKNRINCINVSNGNKYGRYMIPDKEVEYLRKLKKDYGSMKQAMLHYQKNWEENWDNVKEPEPENTVIKSVVTNITVENTKSKKFDVDSIATTISYIQDIKERLNDIEAEKNQLTAELESLRKEVMEYL